jgi:hypothetical protein
LNFIFVFGVVIPVSWPGSRVWNVNLDWYQFFFIIFFTLIFFLFYHLILNFLKIELCDFFIFLFMRLSHSHKLGWVPSGFAQFSSILFFGYFLKLNIFPAPPFYIFFRIGLHNSYYLLSIRFSRSYDLTCKVKRLYLSLLVFYFFRVFFVDLLLLLYIWTDGNWTSLFFFLWGNPTSWFMSQVFYVNLDWLELIFFYFFNFIFNI